VKAESLIDYQCKVCAIAVIGHRSNTRVALTHWFFVIYAEQ